MRARVLVLVGVLALPLVSATPALAGGGVGPCTGVSTSDQLTMRDLCFDGVAHVASPGSTITVVNQGQMTHNLIAVEGGFGIKGLAPGERSEIRVDRPGVYQYYCSFHGSASGAGMAGVLVVEDRASLAAARSQSGTIASAASPASAAATTPTKPPGSAWGWVALAALLLAGGALCVSLALVRPRGA